jgi:hypothetical protein
VKEKETNKNKRTWIECEFKEQEKEKKIGVEI